MSLLLRPELPPTCASMLTLVAALAVADGIREVCDLEAKIKWPNDIVVNGKKVCGILTEMSTELECINYIVTGIGINVAITSSRRRFGMWNVSVSGDRKRSAPQPAYRRDHACV